MTQFKPGDRVTHNPTGEEWILVAVYGSYVKPGGWPESYALASDCTTTEELEACTRACDAVVL